LRARSSRRAADRDDRGRGGSFGPFRAARWDRWADRGAAVGAATHSASDRATRAAPGTGDGARHGAGRPQAATARRRDPQSRRGEPPG